MNDLIALLGSDANLANFVAAVGGLIVAFLALLVSSISMWSAIQAMKAQQKHNRLSVRPLAEVTLADYEDSLRVKLRNNGTGPMIITNINVTDGNSSKESVVEWMPSLPSGRCWNTFSHALEDRTLQPAGEIILLELTEYEGEDDFYSCRDLVRKALATLTITVTYTDIYNEVMPERVKNLSWFSRSG